MAHLSQRNGKLHITWKEGRTVKRKSTGCTSDQRAKAEVLLEQFKVEKQLQRIDRFYKHRKKPIAEHLTDYIAWKAARGMTDKQVRESESCLKRIIEGAKLKKLDDLTEERIDGFLATLMINWTMKKGAKPRKAGPRTRNGYRDNIRAFTNWLYRNKRTEHHLLTNLRDENEDLDKRHLRTNLEDHELTALLDAAKASTKVIEGITGPDRAMLYYLGATTGLRRKELSSLTPESFRWEKEASTITVEASWSKARRAHVLYLPPWSLPIIKPWVEQLESGTLLFPGLATKKTDKMIEQDLTAAGVPYKLPTGEVRDFHSLRHTFITRAWSTGASAAVVQQLARHADIRTTMGYSHMSGWEMRRASAAMPNFAKAPKRPK